MLDFNHQPTLSEKLTDLIDCALQTERQAQTSRNYLGASRLGVACVVMLMACSLEGLNQSEKVILRFGSVNH